MLGRRQEELRTSSVLLQIGSRLVGIDGNEISFVRVVDRYLFDVDERYELFVLCEVQHLSFQPSLEIVRDSCRRPDPWVHADFLSSRCE